MAHDPDNRMSLNEAMLRLEELTAKGEEESSSKKSVLRLLRKFKAYSWGGNDWILFEFIIANIRKNCSGISQEVDEKNFKPI